MRRCRTLGVEGEEGMNSETRARGMTAAQQSERVNADQRSAPDPGEATRKLFLRPAGAGTGEKQEPGRWRRD